MKAGRARGQEVLCFVLALVKCTRIYLSGANDTPCFLAQSKHLSWTVYSIPQFSSVDLPKARAFTSFTKLTPEARIVERLQISTRWVL
jgi:hypothetical protein